MGEKEASTWINKSGLIPKQSIQTYLDYFNTDFVI